MGVLMEFFGLLTASFFEIASGLGAVYAIYRITKIWLTFQTAATPSEVRSIWFRATGWAAVAIALLVICGILGNRSWGVLAASCVVVIFLYVVVTVLARLRSRALKASVAPAPIVAPVHTASIRSLAPDRVRGIGEDGVPVILGAAELIDIDGITGRVRLLNWQAALAARVGGVGPIPILGFWNDDSSLFIYPDDDVVLAGG